MASPRVDRSFDESKSSAVEPMQELVDLDDVELDADDSSDADDVDGSDETEDSKVLYARSTDIRRRIEERLEVRMLREELGMDDFDLE